MFGLTTQDLISQDILRLISLFLHFLVHYTYLSEFPNQLCLFTWILEDFGHETEDALALHLEVLCPLSEYRFPWRYARYFETPSRTNFGLILGLGVG